MTGNGKPINGMVVMIHNEPFCVRNEESSIYGKITQHPEFKSLQQKRTGSGATLDQMSMMAEAA